MSLELIIRPEAETDIENAFDWYENRVHGLGSEFLLVLDAIFNSILRNHLLYPVVHRNVRRALTRRFPYAVFFIIQESKIVILSVFHVKRSPKIWMGRV
ncbi:MAG: type II toxin-antitoxin system RelE/ParE family toxin [Syntrophaceae bacterium]